MKSRLFILMLIVAVNGLPGCSRKPDSSQRLQESAVDRAYKVDSPKKSVSGSQTESSEVTEVAVAASPETSMNIEPGVPRIWQNGPSAKEKARRNPLRHRRPVISDREALEGRGRLGAPLLDTTGLKRIDSL